MGYLDHLRACTAHDLTRFVPFHVAGSRVGWIRTALVPHLCRFADVFRIDDAVVALSPGLDGFEARTRAIDEVMAALVADGVMHPPRGERYAVSTGWNRPALLVLDRAYVPVFGTRAYGVHVNGVVRAPDGPALWIGRRASDRLVSPGKLDNMVAGGNPHGIGLVDNLVKEAGEEAGLPPELARRACPVGALGYRMEVAEGLRDDVLFLYDLDMPADVLPVNTDGEVEAFALMPVGEVAARVRDSFDFKFNVALVLIDFLIRHGVITPDDPDYLDLVAGRWRLG
ncbi:MAG: DUF4743 domain-containing protein [Rhodospirillaceae bacterium]|nr:DUF4743 domain-containing protein [Rhodospirillaceae bacterium]